MSLTRGAGSLLEGRLRRSTRLLDSYRRSSALSVWSVACLGLLVWVNLLSGGGASMSGPWPIPALVLNGAVLAANIGSLVWQYSGIRRLESGNEPLAVGPLAQALSGEPQRGIAVGFLSAAVGGERRQLVTNRRHRARLISRIAALLPRLPARDADLLPDSHIDALADLLVRANPVVHLQFVLETLRFFHRIEDARILHAMEGMATALPLSADVIQVRDLARELLPDMRRFASRNPDGARLVRASANPADPATTLVRPAQPGSGATANLVRAAGHSEGTEPAADDRAVEPENSQQVG